MVGMELNQMLKRIHSVKCGSLKCLNGKHCIHRLLIECNVITSDKLYHLPVRNTCMGGGCLQQHKDPVESATFTCDMIWKYCRVPVAFTNM